MARQGPLSNGLPELSDASFDLNVIKRSSDPQVQSVLGCVVNVEPCGSAVPIDKKVAPGIVLINSGKLRWNARIVQGFQKESGCGFGLFDQSVLGGGFVLRVRSCLLRLACTSSQAAA